MQRRDFITLLGGAAATWPLTALAQQPERMRRVSMLLGLAEKDPEATGRVKAFRLGMRDLGWIEGRNVQIEYRFAGTNSESINKHVAELIRLAPDVIVANTTPVLAALRPATSTIPIVFAMVNDPVSQGFISSLAHPGGNITGFSFIESEIVGKWINLLADVKPNLSRVALMFNPDSVPYFDVYLRSFKALPQQTSVEIEAVHVRSVAEVELAIAKLGREPGSGLIAASDAFILAVRGAILKAADQHRVPVVSPYRQFVIEGSLMSYGPDTADIFRRSASYVDRILKGESPGNLPAQSPVKFELVVNLKTAKALGLSLRESFLLLADEVIE
jgi:putative tryptophan/tyrosine transport system substrate-binding protein